MADESWRIPSIVQEVAVTVPEPPSRYLLPEKERLGGDELVGAEMPEPVPNIDLRRLLASDDVGAEDEAAKLRSALQNWGFFLVTNHRIEASLIDTIMTSSREFFDQPLGRKQEYSNVTKGKQWKLEGYGNDPVKTQDQILNWADRLHLRIEPEDGRNIARWPRHPESFRDLLHEYTLNCRSVKEGILRAMAKILDLDEDCLISQFSKKSTAYARFNYYPACPRPDLVLGIKPHFDGCVLTLLLMAVLTLLYTNRSRKAIDILSWLLPTQVMTNGIFRSPMHRVVTNSEKERMSLAIFYDVDLDKELEPIAQLLDEKKPAKYKKIKYKMINRYEFFSKGERAIESLKI